MRIIGGTLKGRSIYVPTSFKGRPTTDFAKEGLFNMLSNRLDWEQTKVLELFAGTGSLGLECISRGAQELLAVELSPVHVAAIKRNYNDLGIDHARALRADVFKIVGQLEQSFGLIIADPPFDHPSMSKLPDLIIRSKAMSAESLIVLEHDRSVDFTNHEAFQETRTFGHVIFSFFRNLKT